jgi:tetrapyrrole methylase family protein/MazG family protein
LRTFLNPQPPFCLWSNDKPMTDNPRDGASPIAGAFLALYELARYLRSEHGCPWDREQGLQSMSKYLVEETSELEDAINRSDSPGISEEWGDTIFMLLMLASIAEETGNFKTENALHSIEEKMIRRHPHVFGGAKVGSAKELLDQWENIKAKEKSAESKSLMENIPQFYSALKRAEYVQKAAATVGFDWPSRDGILDKIEEETRELREAIASHNEHEAGEELGDLLFSCVNLARFAAMDVESLLSKTIDKFMERFKFIETELLRAGKSLDEATLREMDDLWEKSKTKHDSSPSSNERI